LAGCWFRQPIVIDTDSVIVVGHTRWKAAQKLGLDKVPVHVALDLTPEQAKAYRIADNATNTLAEWDLNLLPLELTALKDLDFDLSLLGFPEDELARLMKAQTTDGLCDPHDVPAPPDEATTKRGEIWLMGNHKLMCGDSALAEDVDRLIDGAPIHLANQDPPYGVHVEPRSANAIAAGNSSFPEAKAKGRMHHQKFDEARQGKKKPTTKQLRAKDRPLANDFLSDEEFIKLLHAWFSNTARVLLPGRAFYCWGGYANVANYPPVLKDTGFYFSQTIIWHKQHPVLTRKDFMGDHEWCQPPGTRVLTPDGSVAIESLRPWDRVIGYDRNYPRRLLHRRHGQEIDVGSRHYRGDLIRVVAGDKETTCTDAHLWTVRLPMEADERYCVYLMRRGPWWRVGKCLVAGRYYGFGLKSRLRQEHGDEAWVLSLHTTIADAMIAEQFAAIKYGIPTTHWDDKGGRNHSARTVVHIRWLYDQLDPEELCRSAHKALADHGRRVEYPLVTRASLMEKMGRRDPFTVRACNLMPGLMTVPVVHRMSRCQTQHEVEYVTIRTTDRAPYDGVVYSLDAPLTRHYVADRMVTHNCFYSWREGAAHQFYGPNNVPDVWPIKKVNPQSMIHLTEKPVELAARALMYSSQPGENVLDLFGGSGSTLIACEQLGRSAFLMEIDPPYCDVIRTRWEQFTGRKAELAKP
jgi:DNA modification methylase